MIQLPFNLPKIIIASHDYSRVFEYVLHEQMWPVGVVATALVDKSFDHRAAGEDDDGLTSHLQGEDRSVFWPFRVNTVP